MFGLSFACVACAIREIPIPYPHQPRERGRGSLWVPNTAIDCGLGFLRRGGEDQALLLNIFKC